MKPYSADTLDEDDAGTGHDNGANQQESVSDTYICLVVAVFPVIGNNTYVAFLLLFCMWRLTCQRRHLLSTLCV